MSEMENKLLPCPFCESANVEFMPDEDQPSEDTTMGFIWCHACGFTSDSFWSEEKAVALWNRRASPANPPLTCEGCAHDGFGKGGQYLGGEICPCYGCRRNPEAADHYVHSPEEASECKR